MLRLRAVAIIVAASCAVAGKVLFRRSERAVAGAERLLAGEAEVDSRDRDQATPLIAAGLSD